MASPGRPPLVDSPETFAELADQYFAQCDEQGEQPLITGLMLHMGFASRQSFYDYEQRPEYSYVVKRSRLRVEMAYERRLGDNACTGAIFALKNMGWSDRQQVEHSGEIRGGVLRVPAADVDPDLWDQMARRDQAMSANGTHANGNGSGA